MATCSCNASRAFYRFSAMTRLEELAKEMLRDQALMAFTARKEGAWETVEWIEGCMKESRKRLAALGVSLDD